MKKILFPLVMLCLFLWHCEKDSTLSALPVSGQGGSLARFAISGDYLYIVDERRLQSFNIADAKNPLLKNTVDVGFDIETIYPFKDKLFIGSASQVFIFSITDPASPQKLASAISPEVIRRCDPVVAKDTVAFATLRTNGECGGVQSRLAVFDIKDITKPVQKATMMLSEPYGLGYSNDVLYVCDNRNGLMVVDITKPYQPSLITTLKDDPGYIDVIPYDNTLICRVSTGMLLYDITANRNPKLLAKIN